MKSDLEMLVEYDMYENGFDPSNPEDIREYWEMMLCNM
jgi:hypothetical protein